MAAPTPSLLDFTQILQRVFNEADGKLRVDSTATVVAGSIDCIIDQADDSIKIGDGVNLVTTTGSMGKRGLDVNVINTQGQYAEDSQHITGDLGNQVLSVRQDVLASSTSADGDYQSIKTDATGSLWVKDQAAIVELQNAVASLVAIDGNTVGLETAINNVLAAVQSLLTNTLSVSDATTHASLTSIISALSGTLNTNDANTQTILSNILAALSSVQLAEPVLTSGTDDGTPTGTEYSVVYNVRQQILASHDRDQAVSYAGFGTVNQRVTQIDYTSSIIGSGAGYTARKSLSYTLDGSRYRLTNITWSLV